MTDLELKLFTERLQEALLVPDALFAILQYGGGTDESCIRANKSGLLLFAGELITAALELDNLPANTIDKTIPLAYRGNWVDPDSDIRISYVTLAEHGVAEPIALPPKETLAAKLGNAGCIVVFVVLVFALLVGLWTMVRWFFT